MFHADLVEDEQDEDDAPKKRKSANGASKVCHLSFFFTPLTYDLSTTPQLLPITLYPSQRDIARYLAIPPSLLSYSLPSPLVPRSFAARNSELADPRPPRNPKQPTTPPTQESP